MLERPFNDLNAWILFFSQAELPVLKRTAQQLAALRENEERIGGRDIAQVALQDPLLTLKVLAYIEAHRRRSQTADITTIDRAVMMLGIAPFFRNFETLTAVESQLQAHPAALLGLLRMITRSRRAAHFARDWAILRHDHDVEEITVAALLHDVAEILLWCFAPDLALRIRELQAHKPGLRSQVAQRAILGISLHDLQLALARAWSLPPLLVTLMDDKYATNMRVRTVACAVNLARHSANGWDDPALPDDFSAIEELLHLNHDVLMARLGRPTEQSAAEPAAAISQP
jgi:HD-like signal output (HDOD) protein